MLLCYVLPRLTRQQLLLYLTQALQIISSHSVAAGIPTPLCYAPRPPTATGCVAATPTPVLLVGGSTIA